MRINYEEFADSYSKSGLSMKAYGERRGMSPSMVSYYLRRSRDSKKELGSFKEIEIIPSFASNKSIRITTKDGLQIEIPL
jgi:predicted transcriptional regulator